MSRVGRLVMALGTVGLFGMGAYIGVVLSAEKNSSCADTYIYADDADWLAD